MAKTKEPRKPEETAESNKRRLQIIFTPISVAFYAGVGYMLYRQVRKRRNGEEQLPQPA